MHYKAVAYVQMLNPSTTGALITFMYYVRTFRFREQSMLFSCRVKSENNTGKECQKQAPVHRRMRAKQDWDMAKTHKARCSPSGQLVKRLLPSKSINCLATTPHHPYLAIGGLKGEVVLLDLESGARTHVRHASEGTVNRLKWSPDGDKLIIECDPKKSETPVSIWDRKVDSLTSIVGTGAIWSADSTKVCTGVKNEGVVVVCDVSTGAVQESFPWIETDYVPELSWFPDGRIKAFCSESGEVVSLQDVSAYANKESGVESVTRTSSMHSVALEMSPNARFHAAVYQKYGMELWPFDVQQFRENMPDCQPLLNFEPPKPDQKVLDNPLYMNAAAISWNPNGSVVAVGLKNRRLWLWDYEGDETEYLYFTHNIAAFEWSGCGRYLCVASAKVDDVHIFDCGAGLRDARWNWIRSQI